MLKHIPALDGVRGMAILLVMLFHLEIPWFSLGWSGVPLFYVLSGFLITSILLSSKEPSFGPGIKIFYMKRSLRIFPLFYLYLTLNGLILVVTGRSMSGYMWYLSYLQNYYIGLNAAQNQPGIVGHTWSLAVEEQFYLIWPLIVFYLGRRSIAILCLGLLLLAPISRFILIHYTNNPYLANITLLSCIDMLAVGAFLSVLKRSRAGGIIIVALSLIGAGLVGYAIAVLGIDQFWSPSRWAKPAFYLPSALALLFGGLVWIGGSNSNGPIVRILSSRPLTFTGKISYGLYIWHPICFIMLKRFWEKFSFCQTGFILQILSFALAYVVAVLSYYIFEVHFLRIKDRQD